MKPLALAFGVLILREQPWNLTVKDALYWWVVAAMLVARTIEEVPSSASDREEKRSALRVITLYAVKVVLLAGLAWVLVQSFRA